MKNTILNTDYYVEAFGGFDSLTDKDAAIKFCLNVLLIDHAIVRLKDLMPPQTRFGAIGGEPDWELERRLVTSQTALGAYKDWPQWAGYRAFVEPEAYRLIYPEGFYDEETFKSFVRNALRAYVARHPDRSDEIKKLAVDLALEI